MFLYTLSLIFFISTAMSKPNYVELDEDDEEMYRNAAYDTPPYEDCDEDDDLHAGKIDLVKDGVWALKAKVKELKAFNEALTANLLITKQKLKELVVKKIKIHKKNGYGVIEKKKHYPYEIYEPNYPQYAGIPYAHDPYIGI